MRCIVAGIVAGLAITNRIAVAEDVAALRASFSAARPAKTLNPLFWLHGDEDEAGIREIIGRMDEGGCGEFTIESRPHKYYLQDKWWQDLAVCFDEAEKRGMKVWVFDEKWFPSGLAGGLVVQADPRFARQYVVPERQDVEGGRAATLKIPAGRLIAMVAGRKGGSGLDMSSLRVIPTSGAEPGSTVRWEAPEGQWSVFCFVQRRDPGYVDSLSSECFDKFIELTHQATYDRFKDKFGKTILGFFTDEPGFGNHGGQLPWTFGFLDLFKAAKGYDLRTFLPALVADVGPETAGIRSDYWDVVVTRYAEAFYKKIGEWCDAHGVRHIGHQYEHSQLHYSFGAGPGHFFRTQQYMHMGGIDLVVGQVWPGTRSQDYWGMPKLASSLSHIYGKADDLAMNETYGAYGWRCGLRDMKWLTDWQCVRGINTLVPHAFNPKWPDEDCPPFFYARGHNPQWVQFGLWADYSNRVCSLLRKGRFVADAIVLYPAESRWIGACEPIEDVEAALQQVQVDFDIVPYGLWIDPGRCVIDGRRARIEQVSYQAVVLPGVEFIPVKALERLGQFVEGGGVVIASQRLPSRSCERGQDGVVQSLTKRIWAGKPDQRAFLVASKAELKQKLREGHFVPDVALWPGHEDLRVMHRRRAGADIFYVSNESIHDAIEGELALPGKGVIEWWDPMTGRCEPVVVFRTTEDRTLVPVRLGPFEAGFFVLNSARRVAAGPRILMTEGGKATGVRMDGDVAVIEAIARHGPDSGGATVFAAAVQIGQDLRSGKVDDVSAEVRDVPSEGWALTFADKTNGGARTAELGCWTQYDRSYSGKGVYRRELDVPEAWVGRGRILLDLGEVQEVAEVRVNGKLAGVRICPPYVFEVTDLVKAGANALEVGVINTLSNRLAGKSRWAQTRPSGLFGPVTMEFGGRVELRLKPGDRCGQQIHAARVRVARDGARATWRTVVPCLGSVRYGIGETLTQTATETGMPRTCHAIELQGLEPETAYRLKFVSGDVASEPMAFKTPELNLLSARRGCRAKASSVQGPGFPAESVIDDDVVGRGWHHERGGWNDATKGQWPDWIAVELPEPKLIGRVDVTTLQDGFETGSWVEPTESLRFTKFGIIDFDVEVRTNGQWQTAARIKDNDRVLRSVRFEPRPVEAVRVVIHKSLADFSRVVEIEAYAR
ncbi:MAG: hypothetical protein JXQ73_23250 [Phycisphaerae bacterium]|nr:hypothetical protein [Phycisphaerae bacterium]